jgi:transcription elongation factor Elf1
LSTIIVVFTTLICQFDELANTAHLYSRRAFRVGRKPPISLVDGGTISTQITGTICGYRVEKIKNKLMQKIRYLDKPIDELTRGKAMEKNLRK